MLEVSLTIHSPDGTIQVPLTKDRLTIGRSDDADLYIDDSGLSRLHASINRDGDRVWIIDEGSTNGSFVNAKPVPAKGMPLTDKDKINIGDYTTIWVSIARPNPHQSAKSPDRTQNSSLPHLPFVVGIILVFGFVGALGWLVLQTFLKGDDGRSYANQNTPVGGESTNKNPSPDPPPQTSSINVQLLANKLAFAILQKEFDSSGKDRYVFDPEFVERISKQIDKYLDVEIKEQDCRDIVLAFSTVRNLPPLLGPVMAMSLSKQKEDASASSDPDNADRRVGRFRVPQRIAIQHRYIKPGSESRLGESEVNTEIAARYMKDLWNHFGEDDFMYAIACYGEAPAEAGKLRELLRGYDPAARKNFWNMVRRGVVRSGAADRVVNFFAAGIAREKSKQCERFIKTPSSVR